MGFNSGFKGLNIWFIPHKTLRKVDQKYLERFKIWCCERMEKITGINHVRNVEVLQRVTEEQNVLQTIKRKTNWICHILSRNCLLKYDMYSYFMFMYGYPD